MKQIRQVKIIKKTHDINWWNRYGLINKTFEVLEGPMKNHVKIEHAEGLYGWIPLDVCEVNPHLKLINNA